MSKIALYLEIDRLRALNARLIYALQCGRAAIDSGLGIAFPSPQPAYCPRCEQVVTTIDDGEACAQCKLVL